MALYKDDEIKKVNFNAIPQEMKDIPQWFMWKAIDTGRSDGKLSKYPTDINGNKIMWNNTDELYTFSEVKNAYESSNQFAGISFNVTGSGLVIIDIDLENDENGQPTLTEKEKAFLNAGYVENSVSGRGYHVVLKGDLPTSLQSSKNVYDEYDNKLEVFYKTGFIAVTGDVYENHSQVDNIGISEQFINYLSKNYKDKNADSPTSHLEAYTEQATNLDSFIPPKVNTSEALNLWINTGGKTLKNRNVDKMALWRREDEAMQKYGNDKSEASFAIVYELAYFMWDNLEGLHSLIVNNRFWNEQDNYMINNAKRLKHDIQKAINKRKRSGKLYQRPDSQNIGNQTASNKVESEEEKRHKSMLEQYKGSNAKDSIKSFIKGIKENVNTPPTSTGFPLLDEVLSGGMREGLTVIGAISSLGKTTMAQQIADNVAQSGRDVLFISLEMARTELMSKSISRETLIEVLENDGDIRNAKTSIGITDASKHKNYSKDEKRLINTAIERYNEYAGHIYIVEAFGQIGFQDVRELVKIHYEKTGKAPIVVIDYLQIMKPDDPRATDKTNTDKAVNGLKQISRDFKTTIVAISSLNRESYNRPMSLTAFKESGAIEYSSDVLIGLDFTKMLENSNEMDFEEEKDKVPRNITLTILKNRNGRTGKRINYLYDPRFNYFEEDDYYKKPEKKKSKKKVI
ncbi:DnaB-like helicase C-terminal domain-containing protein [Staphylococcus epidermidis]|uniref:DnaB-like helicase C-terminal domain-containing protein n=1 Tax=Staphylococcus epidermidis TaxID=1282 RepID=UPI0020949BCF|nr:DnaB-like helicase C-terminal domain-containing protein [Staphylococcus epidermidis]MCO6321393.1 hypothetical protein [Staphylococcus epidermidis]